MYIKFWSENLTGRDYAGRARSRWEHNTRMDLEEVGWEAVDWIHLAEERDECPAVVNTVMNLRVL
jgi:hypothetical protein